MNSSQPAEGVIQFNYQLISSHPPAWSLCTELDSWRTLLFRLELTGQIASRYEGLAYGNVSQRISSRSFLISGSQTGGLPRLEPHHYCIVDEFDLERNQLSARGVAPPSSETMTHAAIYRVSPKTHAVLHIHSPELWQATKELGLATTPTGVTYGTPAMARAVTALLTPGAPQIIAMGGHEDGLLAIGPSVEEAGLTLIATFARVLRRSSSLL